MWEILVADFSKEHFWLIALRQYSKSSYYQWTIRNRFGAQDDIRLGLSAKISC